MKKILIAEDQLMLRGALSTLLAMEDDLEVVAEVGNGLEALEAIERLNPDVCLLDIEMPHMSGLEVAAKLRKENHPTKIIIVTTFTRAGYLQRAIDVEVDGYLLKDEPIEFLIESIRRVLKGERVISRDLAPILFQQKPNPLTEREIEVLRLTKQGLTTAEISQTLFLTKGTVRNYLSEAIQKLEAKSRQHAVQIADEQGWI